jgi:hypothetical protein
MTDWNQPDSLTALRPWLLIDPLTIFQATMLIFGRDPSHEITGRPTGYTPIATAIKQAIERGELPAQRPVDPYWGNSFYSLDAEDKTFLRQADMRDWLEKIGQREAFFFLTDPEHWPNAIGKAPAVTDKPLDTRERTTLLTIIGALAGVANLDLSQHNKAGDTVAAMLAVEGVKLSGRTIGEHLKAVREAMDSRKVK